jgi:hypothetical protein
MDDLKYPGNTDKKEVDRRTVLTGLLGGGAAAFELMHPGFALAQAEQKQGTNYMRLVMDARTDYDRKAIESLLGVPSKKMKDVSPGELREISRFGQRVYTGISSGLTAQEQIRKSYPRGSLRHNGNIEIIVLPPSDIQGGGAEFGHSDNEEPNVLAVSEEFPVNKFMSSIVHELGHGGYGPGEVRASYVGALGCMYVTAHRLVERPELITNEDNVAQLWNWSKQAAFLQQRVQKMTQGAFTNKDLYYTFLPTYLINGLRQTRLQGNTPYDPYQILPGMHQEFEASLLRSFAGDLRAAQDKIAFIRGVVEGSIRESVHLIKNFNPNAVLPADLKSFEEKR